MMLLLWKRATRETSTRPSVFEDLALPLLPALYNVAHWLTRKASDAEDLVQETFLKSLRGFAGFEPESNFQAWISRILRNTYLTCAADWQPAERLRWKMSWMNAPNRDLNFIRRVLSIWMLRILALIRFISRESAGPTGCVRRYGR